MHLLLILVEFGAIRCGSTGTDKAIVYSDPTYWRTNYKLGGHWKVVKIDETKFKLQLLGTVDAIENEILINRQVLPPQANKLHIGDEIRYLTGIVALNTDCRYYLNINAQETQSIHFVFLSTRNSAIADFEPAAGLIISTYNFKMLGYQLNRLEGIAAQITNNLKCPDIIALIEVIDDNDTLYTLDKLVELIQHISGVEYQIASDLKGDYMTKRNLIKNLFKSFYTVKITFIKYLVLID